GLPDRRQRPSLSSKLMWGRSGCPERPHIYKSGGVLLSHTVPHAVPSALKSLASGFGMRPGVSPSPKPPKHSPPHSHTGRTVRTTQWTRSTFEDKPSAY